MSVLVYTVALKNCFVLVSLLQCELQHWVDVMDKFDEILASVAKPVNGSSWILAYDKLDQLEGLEIAVSLNCV